MILYLSFFGINSVTLFDNDEAVFAETAKEMMENSNWITPIYNGRNRYDKPILFYWFIAASYQVFGINEFGARFPSALASLLLAASIFFFMRHIYDEKKAVYTTISFVVTSYFLVYSHAAVTDMTLTLFITLSLFSFYLSKTVYTPSNKQASRYLYGFYLFSALAFLTKGLIGILFPFGIAILFIISTEGFRSVKKMFIVRGIGLFLLISMPWYTVQFMTNGQEFFNEFFLWHHLTRYTGNVSGHRGALYFYIPVILIGMFPWSAFLPAGIAHTFRKKDKLNIFVLIWFAFIFAFFSFSVTKLPNYILPALPAASILIGDVMTAQEKKWLRYSNILLTFFSLAMTIALLSMKNYLPNIAYFNYGWVWFLIAITMTMAVLGIYNALKNKSLYWVTTCLMVLFLSILMLKALPVANQYLQGTLYRYALIAKERLNDQSSFIQFNVNKPSLVFYSGHKTIDLRGKTGKKALKGNQGHIIIVTKAKAKKIKFLVQEGYIVLDSDKKYALLEKR